MLFHLKIEVSRKKINMDKGFLNNFGRQVALYSNVHIKMIEERQQIAIWDKRLELFWKWGKYFNLYILSVICLYIVVIHSPVIILLIQIVVQYIDFGTGFTAVFELLWNPIKTPYRLVDYNKLFWAKIIKTIEHFKCNRYTCM